MAKICENPNIRPLKHDHKEPLNDVLQLRAIKSMRESLAINGVFASDSDLVSSNILSKLRRFPKRSLRNFSLLDKSCPFCKIRLFSYEHFEKGDEDESLWFYPVIARVEYCNDCIYWRFHHLETYAIDRGGMHEAHNYTSHISKIREFEPNLPESCSSELSQWLRRDNGKFHLINPNRLEKLVADIFRANYDYAEVIHVGRPDDGGVDVVFIDTNNNKWLIQVKRREKPNTSEPVETIRNLLGTLVLESSNFGIVVSTADHFTYRAYEAANRAKERGMILELIDRGKIRKMLGPLLPNNPWIDLINNRYPDIADRFSANSTDLSKKSIYKQLSLF